MRHKLEYPNQGVCGKYKKRVDVVIFMHSQLVKVNLSGKRVFVHHGGSAYREKHKKLNKIFNPIVKRSIIQTADLLGLGAKNEVWLLPGIDTESIKPVYERHEKVIIGHFPSKARIKNSKAINKVISRLKGDFEYIYSPEGVTWEKQMERMSKCDVYIDGCMPKINKRRYGEWGMAALEAAALGKVVISHFLSQDKYKGKCGIKVANSPAEIESHLKALLALTDEELLKEKQATRAW
ncbi:unnamed protein product, partial [marine sediment metagenome]